MKSCANLCTLYYKNIIITSLEGIKRKSQWLRCSKCDVYFHFGRIKCYLCPCCHVTLKRDVRNARLRRKAYDRKYYKNHKAWKLLYKKIKRYMKKEDVTG